MTGTRPSKRSARRAVIHIGTEKTGTTSLQSVLANSRDWLRGQGVLFPLSPGKVNHTRLVAAAEDNGVTDNIKAHIMASRHETETRLRANFRADLKREITAGPDWHTVVFSSELIHSRLHTRSEIDRLMSFVSDWVDEVIVVAVLRRQDQLALSRFSTAIRAGHTGFDDVFGDIAEHAYRRLPPKRDVSDFVHYYDYSKLLNRFSRHADDRNIVVRQYETDGIRTDPVHLLAEVLGIDPARLSDTSPSLNSAMSAQAQFVISRINQRIPPYQPSGKRNEDVVDLKRRIEAELPGPPRTMPRDDARAFLARFDESNEALRERFFPDRKSLFGDDVSMYPKTVDYSEFQDRLGPTVTRYIATLVPDTQQQSTLHRTLGRIRALWAD